LARRAILPILPPLLWPRLLLRFRPARSPPPGRSATASASAAAADACCSALLQAGKRFRTAPGDIVLKIGSEKDRLRIFNDMTNDVHIGSWLDTSSAAKAAFVETERCKCKICKTTKQYVKMSDMRAHADGPTHKKKAGEMVAALRLKECNPKPLP
jgi:hypothetical protein